MNRAPVLCCADVHHLAIQTRAGSNDGPQCQECQMVVAELKSLIENPVRSRTRLRAMPLSVALGL